ncbi:protein MAINTENANCE OF PSII UNDER HIGH LIGHT 1 [Rhodamnia argentea]|uniref:Protein MAINTENANCE OF PSII UNDER HIGH LIGHT 1 n=1 Tax=Rhodamnia argentea TaxID=178133 RepID=A0A8B8PIH5_9MYRT|nr:protein MAINTENANCE OF PSII UNDER HIGH LIGHT 1 [Rhodamnia argentea]
MLLSVPLVKSNQSSFRSEAGKILRPSDLSQPHKKLKRAFFLRICGREREIMACASQALMNTLISANGCAFNPSPRFFSGRCQPLTKREPKPSAVRASSDDADCNVEECAPDKEVGKVSMEWLAGDKTKVAGTFPPKKKGWTGYVEKDTAGQTNIYSVEPAIYIAESAISSGTAGSSADGAENTVAVAAGLALISIAAASAVLLQVSKNEPQVPTAVYSGPALSYYIDKFRPPEIIQASVPSQIESAVATQPEMSAPEVSQIQAASSDQPEATS